MAANIHPLAFVDHSARLGADVQIGPFAFVGPGVSIGDRTRLHHHASVEGDTVLGPDCEVFPHACIGAKTQDLKFREGDKTGVRIGARNVFREYVTVHAGTPAGSNTVIGDGNVLLAYSHVAHDCVLGNGIVMSNAVALAGHIVVEDFATIGGLTGAHQFVRIGAYAMVGGMSAVTKDVPPFCIASGNYAVVRSINKIGLERHGFTPAQIERVKHIHRVLFREGLNITQAAERLRSEPGAETPETARMLAFIAASERGIMGAA
ncbi:MAG: acyl-ACP--UDP-N-acetylglucosamine O-acyltransferase [Opitutaceae bacterium]|jgi:UDP-N-acetylglucosamine acyltransferase|nr:acyl-ACP--UDP-N-acetylglucosamine O-acyltransferase [Opitutaceae bacterium]